MAKGKYQEWLTHDSLHQITEWSRQGLSEEQIASNMGITYRCLNNWKNKYVPIFQAIKKGRERPIEELENAMYKKALGFTEGKTYYPPDNVSLIFLLKNWDKEHYRDRPLNQLEAEKLKLENEKLKKENEIQKYKLEELKQIFSGDNPILQKLNEYLEEFNET